MKTKQRKKREKDSDEKYDAIRNETKLKCLQTAIKTIKNYKTVNSFNVYYQLVQLTFAVNSSNNNKNSTITTVPVTDHWRLMMC